MVRTYWFLPVFNEASGNLDLQPFARIDQVEACRPRAMSCFDCSGSRQARWEFPKRAPDGGAKLDEVQGSARNRTEEKQMGEREFDVVVLGAGAPGEVCAGRLADGGLRSRSSSRTWSAASAPTTPACPRRRCCDPRELLAEARRVPGVAEAVTRRARRRGGAGPPRRGDPRPRRLLPASLAGGPRHRALPRRGRLDGERRVVGRRRRPARPQGGRRRHRQQAAMPPIEGLAEAKPGTTARRPPRSRSPRAWSCSAAARSASSWPRPGTPRLGGVAGRRRWTGCWRMRSRSPASSRRRAPRGRRRRSAPAPRRQPSGRTGATSSVELEGGEKVDGRAAPGRHRPQAPHRGHRARDASESRPKAGSRSTTSCGSADASGSTRSATSTAGRCSPTWASTRRGSAATTSSARRSRRPPTSKRRRGSPSPIPRWRRSGTPCPAREGRHRRSRG